ncbi:tautomerase family protein [Campylobacter concisus]|uniref:tautomerase family protein n=1 Tax=Campylobacter concisus TaxID=199 RepID=UPI000D324250|nr:4-oxalocrotonate tautomerase family protein [Campylobacter concisus]
MPYVNIKIAGPEPTKEQKDQVYKEVTDTLVRVLGKKKESVMIFLETHDAGNIGVGGESIENKRKGTK